MKKFQELLTKDLGWKLLSIAIAATMWFMVINITQPVDTRSYSRPLTLENMDTLTSRGLTVGNAEELKNTKITVNVKDPRTSLARLSQNPDWITASVDLSELAYAVNGDSVALPVNVSIDQGGTAYAISSKAPAVVEAQVETLRTKEFPIEVELNGKPNSDIILSDPVLSAETVTVSGPVSLVRQVAKVKAIINAEELEENTDIHAKLACYDYHGAEVTGVSLNIREVTVSYAVHDAKQVPIQVDITGTPANGYQVGTVSCSPKYAEVTGSKRGRIFAIDATENRNGGYLWGKYYIDGNVVDGGADDKNSQKATANNWEYGVYNQFSNNYKKVVTQKTKDSIRLDKPHEFASVTTHSAFNAYKQVLDYAGCSLHRDDVDARIVKETRTRTAGYKGLNVHNGEGGIWKSEGYPKPGLIDSQDDLLSLNTSENVSAWPVLLQRSTLIDSDNDGMPDAWERKFGLNPHDASDGNGKTIDKYGQYTNLEMYMNSLVHDIIEKQNSGGKK